MVMGGRSHRNPYLGGIRSTEIYDTESGIWKLSPNLAPYNMIDSTACVLNDCLFVAGGLNSNKFLVWETKEWKIKQPMPGVRSVHIERNPQISYTFTIQKQICDSRSTPSVFICKLHCY